MKSIALLLLLLAPAGVRAGDAAAAKAAYMKGAELEKAKNYRAAYQEYSNALKADPSYFYAWKQLGNCFYYLGYNPQAVQAYEKYLAAVPSDDKIKAFVASLKAKVNSSTGQSAASANAAKPGEGIYRMQGWAEPSGDIKGYNFYIATEEYPDRDKMTKVNPQPVTQTAYTIEHLTLNKTYYLFLSLVQSHGESDPKPQGSFIASPVE